MLARNVGCCPSLRNVAVDGTLCGSRDCHTDAAECVCLGRAQPRRGRRRVGRCCLFQHACGIRPIRISGDPGVHVRTALSHFNAEREGRGEASGALETGRPRTRSASKGCSAFMERSSEIELHVLKAGKIGGCLKCFAISIRTRGSRSQSVPKGRHAGCIRVCC